MKESILEIPIPYPFDLKSTITSHGWVVLPPNKFDKEEEIFSRVEQLTSGKVVELSVPLKEKQPVDCFFLDIKSHKKLTEKESKGISERLRHMLRLEEDFAPFYEMCSQNGPPWEVLCSGGGRLLRSPTLFEDLVKVILTTNIQWGGTKRMVKELVDAYGENLTENGVQKSFPSSGKIARDSLDKFKEKVNLGYRAEYIHEIAMGYTNGKISDNDYLDSKRCTEEVRKKLLAIKGIGPYAAATMLMLLGRYDDIPVDTIFREFVTGRYFQGRDFKLQDALAIYDRWGKWKYLAYWFDDH